MERLIILSLLIQITICHNFERVPGGLSGETVITGYWDCNVVSCSWSAYIHTKNGLPVRACYKDGVTYREPTTEGSYTCNNQQPFVINSTLAYGYTAVSFKGGADFDHCCSCYLLSFKGELEGKRMVLQATNTGSDLKENSFDLQIPGCGVGLYNSCTSQWDAPEDGWGDRYGGVHSEEECNQLPTQLQEGCKFRFTWMEGVPNPAATFEEVKCPAELIDRSNCGDL
ncbi:endoglucanase-like [Diorhabda sublineata]|uniref:endoglucanase-like n=1 Tax=Diorhabda sublineata TaxID=1163346 RepID=UPI0024E15DD6|nr:endoglucanase-like [Diorhabda sublineata]